MLKVGFGYDAHRLVEGCKLILGGVKIPHSTGLKGHSDADVLTHAIIDALIGALGKGDIGQHFPDNDPTYRNISSLIMLKRVVAWMKREQLRLNNLDATIVAQAPRLVHYLPEMQEKLAEGFGSRPEQINIKATTTEKMGPSGRCEGIEAYAVLSLVAGFVE